MKVTVITGSRADWNGLGMVAHELQRLDVDVEVIAIGQHAESEDSLRTVIADGFDPRLCATNFRDEMAIGCGTAALIVQGALRDERPDMALLCGDRFEILGAATAAAMLRIPIAHIGGGDITEGSIDNKLRYAITELSDLHFTTSERAMDRIADRHSKSYAFGNPALDRIAKTPIVSRETLFQQLALAPSKHNVLVAYHAATLDERPWESCMVMLDILDKLQDASFLVLGTNADTGSEAINELLLQFTGAANRRWRGNLTPELYYSALWYFDCMIGNSSAGLIETPAFGIPVVNIGHRQNGRSQPRNCHTYPATGAAIEYGLKTALMSPKTPCTNPYGDGKSAPRIAKIIAGWTS